MGFPERAAVGAGFLAFCFVVFMCGFIGHFDASSTWGSALVAYAVVCGGVWLVLRTAWFVFRFGA